MKVKGRQRSEENMALKARHRSVREERAGPGTTLWREKWKSMETSGGSSWKLSHWGPLRWTPLTAPLANPLIGRGGDFPSSTSACMLPLYDSAKGHEILSSSPDYPVTDPHIVRGPGCSSICTTMKRERYRGLGIVIIHTITWVCIVIIFKICSVFNIWVIWALFSEFLILKLLLIVPVFTMWPTNV